jgi:hypothetical protein
MRRLSVAAFVTLDSSLRSASRQAGSLLEEFLLEFRLLLGAGPVDELAYLKVGEMRLLNPALTELSKLPIALLQPPHVPNSLAFSYLVCQWSGL